MLLFWKSDAQEYIQGARQTYGDFIVLMVSQHKFSHKNKTPVESQTGFSEYRVLWVFEDLVLREMKIILCN